MALHLKYAEQMAHHPFGHALYHPKSLQEIRPGLCGYFDRLGQWQPIVDLTKPEELLKKGFSQIELPERAPKGPYMEWGPKTSSNVKSEKTGTSLGVSATAVGAPVGGEVHFEFSTGHDYGAVLLTAAPVEHDSFYHRQRFLSWCKENQAALLRYAPEIQKQELWIITGAHTTPKCSLTVSVSKSRAVKVGFGAEAVVAGKLDMCREWAIKTTDNGWIHAGQVPSKTNSTLPKDADDRVVVFISSLHFCFRKKRGPRPPHFQDKQEKRGLLDSILDMRAPSRNTALITLTMATVGFVWMGIYYRYSIKGNVADQVCDVHMPIQRDVNKAQPNEHNKRVSQIRGGLRTTSGSQWMGGDSIRGFSGRTTRPYNQIVDEASPPISKSYISGARGRRAVEDAELSPIDLGQFSGAMHGMMDFREFGRLDKEEDTNSAKPNSERWQRVHEDSRSRSETHDAGGFETVANPNREDDMTPLADPRGRASSHSEGKSRPKLPYKVKALAGYRTEVAEDLPFSKGQMITVTEEEDDYWWSGEYQEESGNKVQGIFPKTLVEIVFPGSTPHRPGVAGPNQELDQQLVDGIESSRSDPSSSDETIDMVACSGWPSSDTTTFPSRAQLRASALADPSGAELIKDSQPSVPSGFKFGRLRSKGGLPRLVSDDSLPTPSRHIPQQYTRLSDITRSQSKSLGNDKAKQYTGGTPSTSSTKIASVVDSQDRIAAFDRSGASAPQVPPKPGGLGESRLGSLIKTSYQAPPPTRNAFVPIARSYRQEENSATEGAGETANKLEQSEEDQSKPMTLKERMALLQQQQSEQQARHAEQQDVHRDESFGFGYRDEPEAPDQGDRDDHEFSEDDEEDYPDPETRKRMELRERMAKMSGGIGRGSMFGLSADPIIGVRKPWISPERPIIPEKHSALSSWTRNTPFDAIGTPFISKDNSRESASGSSEMLPNTSHLAPSRRRLSPTERKPLPKHAGNHQDSQQAQMCSDLSYLGSIGNDENEQHAPGTRPVEAISKIEDTKGLMPSKVPFDGERVMGGDIGRARKKGKMSEQIFESAEEGHTLRCEDVTNDRETLDLDSLMSGPEAPSTLGMSYSREDTGLTWRTVSGPTPTTSSNREPPGMDALMSGSGSPLGRDRSSIGTDRESTNTIRPESQHHYRYQYPGFNQPVEDHDLASSPSAANFTHTVPVTSRARVDPLDIGDALDKEIEELIAHMRERSMERSLDTRNVPRGFDGLRRPSQSRSTRLMRESRSVRSRPRSTSPPLPQEGVRPPPAMDRNKQLGFSGIGPPSPPQGTFRPASYQPRRRSIQYRSVYNGEAMPHSPTVEIEQNPSPGLTNPRASPRRPVLIDTDDRQYARARRPSRPLRPRPSRPWSAPSAREIRDDLSDESDRRSRSTRADFESTGAPRDPHEIRLAPAWSLPRRPLRSRDDESSETPDIDSQDWARSRRQFKLTFDEDDHPDRECVAPRRYRAVSPVLNPVLFSRDSDDWRRGDRRRRDSSDDYYTSDDVDELELDLEMVSEYVGAEPGEEEAKALLVRGPLAGEFKSAFKPLHPVTLDLDLERLSLHVPDVD